MGQRPEQRKFARERVKKRLLAEPTLVNQQLIGSIQFCTNKMIREIREEFGINTPKTDYAARKKNG